MKKLILATLSVVILGSFGFATKDIPAGTGHDNNDVRAVTLRGNGSMSPESGSPTSATTLTVDSASTVWANGLDKNDNVFINKGGYANLLMNGGHIFLRQGAAVTISNGGPSPVYVTHWNGFSQRIGPGEQVFVKAKLF